MMKKRFCRKGRTLCLQPLPWPQALFRLPIMTKNDQMVIFANCIKDIAFMPQPAQGTHGASSGIVAPTREVGAASACQTQLLAPKRRSRGPSAEKTANTQQQIAHAALAAFVQNGIAKTTMAQIAQRAQVAKGTLYLYYPSKDELLRGVVAHALRQSAINHPLARMPGESVHALMRRSLLPTLHELEHSERGDLARLILSEAHLQPELARLYKEMAFDPWQRYVTGLLQLAVNEGELQTPSVAACAQLLSSPFWMGMVRSGLPASGGAPDCDVAELTGLLLDSLFGVRTVAAPGKA